MSLRFVAASIAGTALSLGIVAPLHAPAEGFKANVSTFAGSGGLGFRDGAAASATFDVPIGVAIGPQNAIYVSDVGSQRIRVIANGVVRTLAGGGRFVDGGTRVQGGYVDGEGASARFNFPAALAVAPDGTVYVADADNHCIRAIASGGAVTTFSGSPAADVPVNGPRASARFHRPMGVAVDTQNDVFVADEGFGIRKISGDGVVSTILSDPDVVGVSVSPDGRTVLASRLSGGLTSIYDGRAVPLPSKNVLSPDSGAHLSDLSDVGHPFATTMVDAYRAFFTDAKVGSIRYVDLYHGASKYLVGSRGTDGSGNVFGFRDGPLGTAQVYEPLGLAVTKNGVLYFADTGNRRIRMIATLDLRQATDTALEALPPEIPDSGSQNIVVVGNSTIWSNCVWDDSWEGILESRLRASGKNVTIYPIMMVAGSASVIFDYIKDVVVNLPNVHQVIFLSNVGVAIETGPNWKQTYVSGLRGAQTALSKAHMSLRVAVAPTAYDFDWSELPIVRMFGDDSGKYFQSSTTVPGVKYDFLDIGIKAGDSTSTAYSDLLSATASSNVPYNDLAPYFLASYRSATPGPFFGTAEWHQSDFGRRVLADAMFIALGQPASRATSAAVYPRR